METWIPQSLNPQSLNRLDQSLLPNKRNPGIFRVKCFFRIGPIEILFTPCQGAYIMWNNAPFNSLNINTHTLHRTDISPLKVPGKMIFLFHRWDSSQEGKSSRTSSETLDLFQSFKKAPCYQDGGHKPCDRGAYSRACDSERVGKRRVDQK